MRAKRRAAALVLGALLGAAAACRAQGIALTVKVFPQNAALAVDGALIPARTGPSVLVLAAGAHSIHLAAAGYQPKDLTVSLSSLLTIEVKLEREGSRLAKRSEMPTGLQPKSVAFTPDGRYRRSPCSRASRALGREEGLHGPRVQPLDFYLARLLLDRRLLVSDRTHLRRRREVCRWWCALR